MKIAAVAYHIQRVSGWVAHEAKLARLFEQADADLVVLPEYAAIEAGIMAGPPEGSVQDWVTAAADRAGDWVDQFRQMAMRYNCHVLAGSGPCRDTTGIVNRSWLISPSGHVQHQDKLILTPYERQHMALTPGRDLRIFDTTLGKIGVNICYDSEFPLLARAQTEAGAQMILVPAATDFPAGQTRVRQSCRARAIENQCLVVHAPLVGSVEGCDIVDQSTGRAAIFGPPDHGLPSDGILAEGKMDLAGPVSANLDLSVISASRDLGQVGNFAHWIEQDERVKTVTTARLDPFDP
ncbi:MAG: carbon-nitrogen hydrolase family protein [Rhodobacteraceae bacterium]|nr:carbon-nitrogen hydrolase family protein [Paracoccaceae bacterium]